MTLYGSGYLSQTVLTIQDHQTITGVDAVLTLGSTISGRLLRAADQNPAQFGVQALVAGGDGTLPLTLQVFTDDDGYFELKSLPPDGYDIVAIPPGDNLSGGQPL